MTKWILSGFGDEIADDPVVQVAVLQALGAGHIEVRSAWGTNIVDLTSDQLSKLRTVLVEREFGVSAIASPIGKVDVSVPTEQELERLRRAVEAAHVLRARYIRLFSFYRGPDQTPEEIRDRVVEHSRAFASYAESQGVVLLHENEKDIYGDIPSRVLDLVRAVDSPAYRLAWDPANFVQVGVRPFTEAYQALRPYVEYLQIKDALSADSSVVPAGMGDGEVEQTLAAFAKDGFEGFVSLEPHLSSAGRLGGFSGPAAFGVAARALTSILDDLGVAYG